VSEAQPPIGTPNIAARSSHGSRITAPHRSPRRARLEPFAAGAWRGSVEVSYRVDVASLQHDGSTALSVLWLDVMDRVGVAAELHYRLDDLAVGRVSLADANVAVHPSVAALDLTDPAIAGHGAGAHLGLFPQGLVGALGILPCAPWQEEVGHGRRLEPRRVAAASGRG